MEIDEKEREISFPPVYHSSESPSVKTSCFVVGRFSSLNEKTRGPGVHGWENELNSVAGRRSSRWNKAGIIFSRGFKRNFSFFLFFFFFFFFLRRFILYFIPFVPRGLRKLKCCPTHNRFNIIAIFFARLQNRPRNKNCRAAAFVKGSHVVMRLPAADMHAHANVNANDAFSLCIAGLMEKHRISLPLPSGVNSPFPPLPGFHGKKNSMHP